MSIPLKTRKVIKDVLPQIEAELQKASASTGVTLSWDDNTAEIYTALESAGENIGKIIEYFQAFSAAVAKIVAEDELSKQALETVLNNAGGKIVLRIIPNSAEDSYFNFSDAGLFIDVKPSYWGSWLSYYNAESFTKNCKVDAFGHQVTLALKRDINKGIVSIEAEMARVAAKYGKPVTFEVDWAALLTHLKANNSETVGTQAVLYAKQFADTFLKFIENADNKEAIEEQLADDKVTFLLAASSDEDKYWQWNGGTLQMQVKASYWGSWLSYYDATRLEATL